MRFDDDFTQSYIAEDCDLEEDDTEETSESGFYRDDIQSAEREAQCCDCGY